MYLGSGKKTSPAEFPSYPRPNWPGLLVGGWLAGGLAGALLPNLTGYSKYIPVL